MSNHISIKSLQRKSWLCLFCLSVLFLCFCVQVPDCEDGSPCGDSGSTNVNDNDTTMLDVRDSTTYRIVKIGTQTWMAENLNYNASGSRCYGDNTGGDSLNYCGAYGRLYDWATAMGLDSSCNTNNCQNQVSAIDDICPDGWHVPSDAEWTTLVRFVGSNAGTKLKSRSGWNDGNGTDNFGFSALPGGYGEDSKFDHVGGHGGWWSATEFNALNTRGRSMNRNDGVYLFNNLKSWQLSLRCIRDVRP